MNKTFAAVTMLGLSLAFLPQAHADTWSKRTTITVHQAIQVPGAILEPGKYVMKLHDLGSSRNIVQISNEQEDGVVATMLTIPHYRQTATDKTEFRFWEIAEGQPKPLRVWFYPGELMGREFLYSKGFATIIAKAAHVQVPAVDTEAKTEAALEKAHIELVNESGVEKAMDLAAYEKTELSHPDILLSHPDILLSHPEVTKLEHAIQGQPEPAPSLLAQAVKPDSHSPAPVHYATLPATASPLPLAGLVSLGALAAGLGIRRIAVRM
jgi:hypothetical protein